MTGAGTWSIAEDDHRRITEHLASLLKESQARCALVVDRTGQLLANAGEALKFDPTAFALSMVSIFIAVVGIALVLQQPSKAQQKHVRMHKGPKQRPA